LRLGRRALFTAAAATVLATAAEAQTAPPPRSDTTVGEIVVTARHRQESLQKVPIAISVVDGAKAASKNLNNIQDISSQVPAVDFRTSASNKDQTVFIRGVGTISTSPGVEPSVSTVIDGVVMARAGSATLDLLDLDHIEVLRGPQGTLFGKNASAGVINIVTRSPTATPSGYIDAALYEGGELRGSAGISGPIVEGKLSGLISGFWSHYDGNVDNIALGREVNGYQNTGARAKLVATPTDNLKITFGADYTHSYETIPTGVWATTNRIAYPTGANTNYPAFAALQTAQGILPSFDNTTISSNALSDAKDENYGASLQLDWDFGHGYRLTSITAYREWFNVQHQDYDQMSVLTKTYPQIADIGHLRFDQTSEELRVASPKGHFLDYLVGAYFLNAVDHEEYERDQYQVGTATPGFNNGVGRYGVTDRNYAVFGEANLNFTRRFRALIGGRVVWDELSFYNNRVSSQPVAITAIQPSFSAAGSETKNGLAGRVGLQYDFTSDTMGYFTASHGYKGPAYNVFFNQTASVTAPLAPETSDSYEIGLKGRFFDEKLQANLDAFYTTFDNYQANSTFLVGGALVTNLVNAGVVRTEGVEADLTARPVEHLTLTANAIYNDAYVVNFPCPPGSAASCYINGGALPFAPRWKTHFEADYLVPLVSAWDLDLQGDFNWQSSTQYQLAQTAQTIQGAYGPWNLSAGLINSPSGLSIRVLVKNLTNEHYSSYIATGNEGATGIVRWVPRDYSRYVGIDIRKTF
jgi:iron complex outermembrane receptor protein